MSFLKESRAFLIYYQKLQQQTKNYQKLQQQKIDTISICRLLWCFII